MNFEQSIRNQLAILLQRERANEWIVADPMHAYIRITSRQIDQKMIKTLDIATVEVSESFRNKGFFKKLLCIVEELANSTSRTVYIENVLNPILDAYMNKIGYHQYFVPGSDIPCYYKS